MINDTSKAVHPNSIVGVAEWVQKNGVESAFISLVLILLFVYFAKLIFRKSPFERIEMIYMMLVEMRAKLDVFLSSLDKDDFNDKK